MNRLMWLAPAVAVVLWVSEAGATPSTNIWNPSTDIQAKDSVHVGVDTYFSIFDNASKPVNFPVDVGVTYGPGYGFEVGVDFVQPTKHPLLFNAKWGMPEKKGLPAFAVGIQGLGIHKASGSNQVYGLVSKTFDQIGRFTAGGYFANPNLVGKDNVGAILAWDRSFGDRWWASVDYATGQNTVGGLGLGAAYKLAPNVGVVFGYVLFPDEASTNDTVTIQFDLDF